jgi:hypothetical protein
MGPTGNPLYTPQVMQGANFPNMVGAIYRAMAGVKGMKQQRAQIEADRAWQKKMYEADLAIRGQEKPQKPLFNITPEAVKSFAKEIGYPDSALAGIESWSQPALDKTWADLNDTYRSLKVQGLIQAGKKPATARGKQQLASLNTAAKMVEARIAPYKTALGQLMSNPQLEIYAPERSGELQKRISELDAMAGEIESMKNNLDETGELTPEQFMRVNTILKFGLAYKPFIPAKKPAETKIIGGVTYYKWSDGKWRTSEEPTQTKK